MIGVFGGPQFDPSRHGNRRGRVIGSTLVKHLVREVGAVTLNVDKLTYAGTLSSLTEIAGTISIISSRPILLTALPCAPHCSNLGRKS